MLAEAYRLALEAYLACPEESTLTGAYELGRKALLDGLSPLDLVSLHASALDEVSSRRAVAIPMSGAQARNRDEPWLRRRP